MDFKQYIRSVPDFPKAGINFYDISTLLAHKQAWNLALDSMQAQVELLKPDFFVGIESRGFLTAAPLSDRMGIGFSMIRKKGKLPGKVVGQDYSLEYGVDTLEIQPDLLPKGARVVICDDLLATGGTVQAAKSLLEQVGVEVVGACFLIELSFLKGRDKLGNTPIKSLMVYDD